MKILICGDFYLETGARAPAVEARLSEIIHSHDIRLVNFEAPIADGDASPSRKIGPSLRMERHVAETARGMGFNLFALANNHSMDYGYTALKDTMDILGHGDTVGAGSFDEAYAPRIFESDGRKIGIMSAGERQFGAIERTSDHGYAWICHPGFGRMVAKAKKACDTLIVFAHTGLEDTDTPLPQWREIMKSILDAGADVIVSTHTHTMQGMETHDGKPIFYSLGNFAFGYKPEMPDWNNGYAVSIDIGADGKIAWKRIGHRLTEQNIIIQEDQDLSRLDELIASGEYHKTTEKMCLDTFERYYAGYYKRALGAPLKNGIFHNIKFMIKQILGLNQIDPYMLWHNIAIESHRYAVEIAIRAMQKHES